MSIDDLVLSTECRMAAMRLEAAGLWAEAAKAWHEAVGFLSAETGTLAGMHRNTMLARAASAERQATEPTAAVSDVGKVDALAEAHDKPEHERTPEAVTRLDAGETQGSTGAR